MKLSRRSFLASSAFAATSLACGTGFSFRSQPAGLLPIGMNLAGIADWEPGFPYKNLMLGARPWMTQYATGETPWDTDACEIRELNENGYPKQVPFTAPDTDRPQVYFTLIPNRRPPGRYVVLWDGDGELEPMLAASVVEREAGRMIWNVNPGPNNTYLGIKITRSNIDDPVHNVRVVEEEFANDDLEAEPWLPEFLEFCAPFHALRFMDWAGTNNSVQSDWSHRKRPDFMTMVSSGGNPEAMSRRALERAQFFGGGVALEHMIELCNRLKTDCWICIPHLANEEYMRNMAELVLAELDPSLTVYVEYSNEIWNWQFQQAQWMLRSTEAAAPLEAQGLNPWEDKEARRGKDHPERIAALFRRAFAIWEDVWANDQERMVRVVAVQHAWFDATQRTLRWCMANGGADALSPAGYFSNLSSAYDEWEQLGDQLTADRVMEDTRLGLTESIKQMRENAALARDHDVRFIIYEGGQHLQPRGQADVPYNVGIAAAQTHPLMYDFYMELLRAHAEEGCDLFAAFSSVGEQGARWGSWGHLEFYGQDVNEMPKMRALVSGNIPR